LQHNAVSFEAVLTNSVPQLPEVVRLAWLLSQLQCDLPVFSDHVNAQRLPHVAAFALLPAVLQAASEVELGPFSPEQIARAVDAWQLPKVANQDTTSVVHAWWQTYLADRPGWPVALMALDQMLG